MKTKRLPATDPVSLGLSHKKCGRVHELKKRSRNKNKAK